MAEPLNINTMQQIDIKISEKKFHQEMDLFLGNEDLQRKRGIILLKALFPDAFFMFTAPQIQPSPVVFAARINFDNYDMEALSVRFVHPFTLENLPNPPVNLYRKLPRIGLAPELQPLAQKDDIGLPFVCIPGVREYHNHPAHTGDSWFLHRNKGGEGTLGFLLEKLYEYGITAINSYQVQVVAQMPNLNLSIDLNLVPQ